MNNQPRRDLAEYMTYGQVGFEMAAPIGLGWFLDTRFGTLPWLTVAGAVLGLVGGIAHLVMMLNAAEGRKPDAK